MHQIILYPDEDDFWVAECPSLPGCISQGQTREEAILNIHEAIQGYIAALEDDGLDNSGFNFCSHLHPHSSTGGRDWTRSKLR